MTMKRKNNAKTATIIASFVVTSTLQPSAPLHLRALVQPPLGSSIMRQRRVSATPSMGSSIWPIIPTARISGESRSGFGLFSSPFDNYDNEIENRTMDDVVELTTSTIEKGDYSASADAKVTEDGVDLNCNTANSTTITTVVLSNDNDEDYAGEKNMFFSIPEESAGFDADEDRRLAIASEKLLRFLKEEAPPISILLLNFVAIIWGSQHAIIKTVVEDSDPAAFTFLRFGLASLISFPYLPGFQQTILTTRNKIKSFGIDDDYDDDEAKNDMNLWTPWRWGIEMGLWMFLGFSLQAIGLQTTTAQRSGFLLYLNVKFVPFFAKVFLGREISKWTWVSAFAAFSGTALLALDGQSLGLNVGDFWSVAAAAASAMFILRLEKASSEVPKSSELNATSLIVVAMLSGAWLLLGNNGQEILSEVTETAFDHPLELVYLGAVSTALANFIQAKAQKDVPAERASIIYSLDPVYGAFFSWIILGETLGGPQAYIGALIIFMAAATNTLLEFSKPEETNG